MCQAIRNTCQCQTICQCKCHLLSLYTCYMINLPEYMQVILSVNISQFLSVHMSVNSCLNTCQIRNLSETTLGYPEVKLDFADESNWMIFIKWYQVIFSNLTFSCNDPFGCRWFGHAGRCCEVTAAMADAGAFFYCVTLVTPLSSALLCQGDPGFSEGRLASAQLGERAVALANGCWEEIQQDGQWNIDQFCL